MAEQLRIMNEAFQMREHHRELLQFNRSYLLHNLCPGETFWSALFEMRVFEPDMLDEMKSQRTRTERVGLLLDLLPHRGPDAFDAFLEALLKCGHGFVADYLKILEVSDQFKTDIKSYNISDHIQDRLIRTYKKSLPNVQRFFETKLEVNLQEQESEFQDKEHEISELEQQTQTLEAGIKETRQWFNDCVTRTTTLGDEVKRSYVLRSALREERKNLESLYEKCSSDEKHEQMVSKFCDGMHSIIDYIQTAEDRKAMLEHKINCGDEEDDAQQNGKFGTNGKTITSKVQGVIDAITSVMEKTVGTGVLEVELEQDIRCELEKTLGKMREIIKDLSYVKRIFLTTLRKKEDLSQETLSLVHNFREIRRLEKEMTEKQDHIQELRNRGQTIKNKSKRHKRHLEQIQEEIAQKEKQLTELYEHLQKQVSSADQRVHFILSLLPDSGEETGPQALADDTKSEGGFSLLSRDLTYISIARDRSETRFSLRSETTDVTLTKTQTASTPAPPKTPVVPHQPPIAVTDTRVAPIQSDPSNSGNNKIKSASKTTPKSAIDNKLKSSGSDESNLSTEAKSFKQIKKEQDMLKPSTQDSSEMPLTQIKNPQANRETPASMPKTPVSAKNKVHPILSNHIQPSHDTRSKTEQKGTTNSRIHQPEKNQSERRLTIGNVSSALEMPKGTPQNELKPNTSGEKQETNLIQVKPAEGSNTIKSKSAKASEQELRKPATPSQPSQRHSQTKPQVAERMNQQTPKYSERFTSKSMAPLSISSARANNTSTSDGKSPNLSDKAAHRSPIPTPRFSIKSSQGQHRFDPTVLMTDRPVPATRSKRQSSSDDKDVKTINEASTPHVQTHEDRMPWTGMSSKQLLKPQNGESDTVISSPNCTYPPTKRQSRAKSMDHVMLGKRTNSTNRQMTQNESVYNRVSDAINKVKDKSPKEATSKAGQASSNMSPPERHNQLSSQRLSISTESSDGQVGDPWLQCSSSDDSNYVQEGSEQGIHTVALRNSSSIASMQQLNTEFDLEEGKRQKPRTLSAETHMSSRSRSQSEDPNKYPQRQILMANKVQLN